MPRKLTINIYSATIPPTDKIETAMAANIACRCRLQNEAAIRSDTMIRRINLVCCGIKGCQRKIADTGYFHLRSSVYHIHHSNFYYSSINGFNLERIVRLFIHCFPRYIFVYPFDPIFRYTFHGVFLHYTIYGSE